MVGSHLNYDRFSHIDNIKLRLILFYLPERRQREALREDRENASHQ